MNTEDVTKVRQLLESAEEIVIVPHKNPDGDAIGSTLGLKHFLEAKGLQATVIAPNDYPRFLKWMPGTEGVMIHEKQEEACNQRIAKADLIFTLDFNELSRCGSLRNVLEHAQADFIMIDHHQQPGDYAVVTYSDTRMSSTCEMVYHFIAALEDTELIGSNAANCLYAGLITDTGSFRFPSVSSTTHRVAADLIDRGARNAEIHQNIFDTNSADRLRLLGCALNNMVILPEYQTAYITLTQEELDRHHYKKGDTEGFVNYGLTLDGIRFAVIFIENRDEGIIKISLRSVGDFSVNEFARKYYQGGGHINAAGGRSEEDMEATVARFRELLKTEEKLQA